MRYLFCSAATYGFISPSIGIALELQRRGHDVAFVTDVSMAEILKQAELQRVARGDRDGRSFQVELFAHPLEIVRQVRHIEYAMQQFRPDVLVGQSPTLGPLIVREQQGIPVAIIGLAAYNWPTPANRQIDKYGSYVQSSYAQVMSGYNQAREMLLLPPCDVYNRENPLLGDLFLLRSVPEFELDTTLPEQVHFVGDCLWEPVQSDEVLRDWLADAVKECVPVLYAQPGRTYDRGSFWTYMKQALGNQHVHVAASVGRLDDEVGMLPRNFFARAHVPQGTVLPRASVVICSSTTTSVLGAITHGLPMLLIPDAGGGDQPHVLMRCRQAQVGLYLSPKAVTLDSFRDSVCQLLEDSTLRQNVQRIQHAFARTGGRNVAADLLEQLAYERGPIRRAADLSGSQMLQGVA